MRATDDVIPIRKWAAGLSFAALCIAALLLIRGSDRHIVGNQSLATIAALAVAIFISTASFVVAYSACRARSVAALLHRICFEAPGQISNRTAAWFVVLAAIAMVGINSSLRSDNRSPRDDQADYLRVAVEIQAAGGPLQLPGALIRGDFVEDNRHPLYPGLLAIRPTFAAGVALSTMFAAATIALTAAAVWGRAGNLAGVIVAVLLATNRSLHDSASLVACETLLCLLVTAAWLCLTSTSSGSALRNLAAGAFLGAAYLAKASAFMLFAVTVVWLAFEPGVRFRIRVQWLLTIAVGFVAIAAPLLVRNARVYGNPLHSFNNRLLFGDSFEVARDEPNLGLRGNWLRFRERHSVSDIVRDRIGRGLAMETFVLLRSLGPWPLDSGRAACGALIAIGAIVACRKRDPLFGQPSIGPARRGWLLLGWTLAFWVFFGWYLPIAASDRFVLPLVPAILGEAAVAMATIVGMCRHQSGGGSGSWAVAGSASGTAARSEPGSGAAAAADGAVPSA